MELDAIKLAVMLAPQVPVVLLCKQASFIERTVRERIDAAQMKVCTVHFASRTFSLSLVREARKIIQEHGIRNVIFFGASELKSLYWSFRGQGLNVIVRHGTTKTGRKTDPLHKLIYSCVSRHVANGQHVARNVRKIFPLPDGMHPEVIYPSFVMSETDEVKRVSAPVEILHVGRVAGGKGQREAVDACAVLEKHGIDFRLRLVGGIEHGDYAKSLERHVAELPFGDRIEFVGQVTNVAHYYRESHVFLFPSYGEGFSNAFSEAILHGLVCIAFDNTGFPEMHDNGFHVHLVPDRDVGRLAETLLDVCRNLAAELERASANSKLASTFFAPERELKQWLDLLI